MTTETIKFNASIEAFKDMLNLQYEFNTRALGSDWRSGVTKEGKVINWSRCILTETVELMESFKWEHWKNLDSKIDIENIKLELTDIWHFILSMILTNINLANDNKLCKFISNVLEDNNICYIKSKEVLDEDIVAKAWREADSMISNLYDFKYSSKLIKVICHNFFNFLKLIGFTFSELYKIYVGKSILNKFRQEHGYKDGTYKKIWNGKEDNYVLMDMVSDIDIKNIKEELYNKLELKYRFLMFKDNIDDIHKQVPIYNYSSSEELEEATIIGGNPNGIVSFNRTPHNWAVTIYKNMVGRTWQPESVDTTIDRVNYHKLSPQTLKAYRLVLSQLITNDSIQTTQLMSSISRWVTSPVVSHCLCKQAYEESVHSRSYSVMVEDICNDKTIFDLYKEDDELYLKNKSIADMYTSLYQGSNPSSEDLLLAFAANQILEELVFPGGFIFFYSIEHIMPGTAAMIMEIHKDESSSHVPLFKHIFRTAVKESFNGIVPGDVISKIHALVKTMTEAEIRWTTYITKDLFGFSNEAIRIFVESQANSVCDNLGIPTVYDKVDISKNPLKILLNKHYIDSGIKQKAQFFETNVADYNKIELDQDGLYDDI